MSSPMFDLPEHFPIGVDAQGNGPVMEDEPEFDHMTCWCWKGDACDAGCDVADRP